MISSCILTSSYRFYIFLFQLVSSSSELGQKTRSVSPRRESRGGSLKMFKDKIFELITIKQTKSAPLWWRYSASLLQPKKCEIKKTTMQYYHQPTYPSSHVIIMQYKPFHPILLIVMQYIWNICMINSFFAQHFCPPSQISVPCLFIPCIHFLLITCSYIYIYAFYIFNCFYIFWDIYMLSCVSYILVFFASQTL